MELADALFEEYKTVRQESLEAAGRMQSVAQYLFAAMGVVVTVAIVGAEKDRTIGAAVVMSLIPITVVVGMAIRRWSSNGSSARGSTRDSSRPGSTPTSSLLRIPGSHGSGNDSPRIFAR